MAFPCMKVALPPIAMGILALDEVVHAPLHLLLRPWVRPAWAVKTESPLPPGSWWLPSSYIIANNQSTVFTCLNSSSSGPLYFQISFYSCR